MNKPKTITIDDIEYVRKSDQKEIAATLNGLDYCIIRTYSAGVFAGYVESRNGKEVTLLKARRLWQWHGAASLSQLSTSGTSQPEKCKFPEEVEKVILTESIEILTCTKQAQDAIASVKVWAQ